MEQIVLQQMNEFYYADQRKKEGRWRFFLQNPKGKL